MKRILELSSKKYWFVVISWWIICAMLFYAPKVTAADEQKISIEELERLVDIAVEGWSAYDYSYFVRLEMYTKSQESNDSD